ncbi:uncharacterized protein LOC135845619 [Planococcus citri]|uniref:uncharacterized protein LOC135845619 n=1 Tax=Planococcus citri TaxID=170843 RepID=UPI0031F8E5F4
MPTSTFHRTVLLAVLSTIWVQTNGLHFPERLNFTELLSKPYFVDKSELLKVFLDGSQFNLVTCPRRFGKSVNLQMVKLFTEIELDENHLPKHYTNTSAYEIFKDKKIFENITFVEEHMCKYVVVHVDLLYNKTVKNFTHDVALQFINDKFYDAFSKFCWILGIPKDQLLARGLQEDEIKFLDRINHKKIVERDLQASLKRLGRILRKFFDAKMIFLLDNYDNVMWNGLSSVRYDIETLYVQLGEVINGIFIHSDDLVYTGMIFSTSRIVLGVKDLYYEKVEQNLFLENHKFSKYFGFTELEVEAILNKVHNNTEDPKKHMMEYYGAYVTKEKKLRIYSPFSVTQYCENVAENEPEPIQNYYIHTEKGADDLYMTLFRFLEFRDLANVYATNGSFEFEPVDKCTQVDFSNFLGLVEKVNEKMKRYDYNLLMTFAMEEGLIGFAFNSKGSKYKWPNLEIRNTLKLTLHKYNVFLDPSQWGTKNDTDFFINCTTIPV